MTPGCGERGCRPKPYGTLDTLRLRRRHSSTLLAQALLNANEAGVEGARQMRGIISLEVRRHLYAGLREGRAFGHA